jgi:hypothetical protein
VHSRKEASFRLNRSCATPADSTILSECPSSRGFQFLRGNHLDATLNARCSFTTVALGLVVVVAGNRLKMPTATPTSRTGIVLSSARCSSLIFLPTPSPTTPLNRPPNDPLNVSVQQPHQDQAARSVNPVSSSTRRLKL